MSCREVTAAAQVATLQSAAASPLESLLRSQPDGLRRFAAPSSFSSLPGLKAAPLPARPQKEDPMITGKVKFFNAQKGYGFIAPEDGSKDAFVHITALERAGLTTLDQDQRVTYDLETDPRGKTSAVNLQTA
jgi:CspA family cold shock protein